jgi:hypothetical protein
MWERLLEIVLFNRTRKHRAPVQILKSFISGGSDKSKISSAEERQLRKIFEFLKDSYRKTSLGTSRLATNQIHFYTMVTSIMAGNLLSTFSPAVLMKKLSDFAAILDGTLKAPKDKKIALSIKNYEELSEKQTTHVGRRDERQTLFIDVIGGLKNK